uniref:Uncharacterized protein n=1 Tax=Avena sativa TaxID=4498 RepID=A0ACD5T9Z2_AVESA
MRGAFPQRRMSCGGRPPPGFGPAAGAGGRRLRGDFGGAKSATRAASTTVNIKTETDDGSLEVQQQSQMQSEAMASQSSCQTNSSLAGNKNASLAKGPYKRVHADETEVASPGVNASSTGQNLPPCKKSKGLGKHGELEGNQGPTELRRPPTPMDLFEDECVFCHSFRTGEVHGPMVLYRKGRIVSSDEGKPTNAKYVHKKCMDWAPRVYYDGDDIVNMEKEITRASKMKCSRCRLPGAALGCCQDGCPRTYHIPCALVIWECYWDAENRHVWCPKHAPDPLPCDKMSSPIKESDITSPVLQNQYLDKQGMSVLHRREDQQVDQPNTLTFSSLPQGQWLDKALSADYQGEEKQTNKSRTLVNPWVLLGSVLSTSEKDSLEEFASLTSSTLAEEWDKNVTHVIVGRSAGTSCGKSYEVLMAILSGKWVVTAGWIVDCLAELIPGPKALAEPITVPEISYEVESIDGPKKGRARAAKGAPKLFSGLHFFLSAYMYPEVRENIKELIEAAEGQVLEVMSLRSLQEKVGKNPAKVYFIYTGGPPRDYASTLFAFKEIEEVRQYRASGAQAISHFWLFGAIASYDARMLEESYREDANFCSC